MDLLDTATTGLTDDILDAVDVPIVVIRRDFTVVCFNKAAGKVLGLAPSHINRALRDVPVLARMPGLEAGCADIVAGGAPRRVDVRDGHKSFVVRIAPYRSGDRQAAGIVLTFANVTAFRASLDQAIYEREYTKTILNTVSDPLVVLGADQRVQSGNRAFHAILRVSRDETQGVLLYELANGAFALAQLRTQLKALLTTSSTFQPLEVEHLHPELGKRTFILDARPLSLPGQSERTILLSLKDITERKQAQARQELLTNEIQHRTKNLFAVVLAVVSRSFVGKYTVEDAQTAVVSRLESLCQTHVMLIDKEWEGADLREIVRSELSPYADRLHIEGPSLMLTASVAQDFALVLHELATNAAKYGALSNATGKVHISWSTDDSNLFTLRWQEQGGPPVRPPTQKGFGSAVLEELMAQHFEVPPRIDFVREGLCYELSGSLDALTSEEGARNAEAAGQPA